jgi:hypothetical protein
MKPNPPHLALICCSFLAAFPALAQTPLSAPSKGTKGDFVKGEEGDLKQGERHPIGNANRKTSQSLWYLQPAEKWSQALPVGNGRLGAMVFGGVDTERLALNEESVWSGRPTQTDRAGAENHAYT